METETALEVRNTGEVSAMPPRNPDRVNHHDKLLEPEKMTFNQICSMGNTFFKSGLLPSLKNAESAAFLMYNAYELKIPMTTGLRHLFVVDGKIGASAELIMAFVQRDIPGFKYRVLKCDRESAKIWFKSDIHPEGEEVEFTFKEIEETGFHQGKNGEKKNWKLWRSDMLFARCITRMKRRYFQTVMMGISHTAEELGAEVDQHGAPLKDVTPAKTEIDSQPVLTQPIPMKSLESKKEFTNEPVIVSKEIKEEDLKTEPLPEKPEEKKESKRQPRKTDLSPADISKKIVEFRRTLEWEVTELQEYSRKKFGFAEITSLAELSIYQKEDLYLDMKGLVDAKPTRS